MKENFDKLKAYFQNIGAIQIVDIILVAAVVMMIFLYLIKTKYYKLVFLLGGVYVATFLLVLFQVPTAKYVFLILSVFSVFTLILLFANDIKRVLWKSKDTSEKLNAKYNCTEDELIATEAEIIKALQNMSKNDVGALLVFTVKDLPPAIIDSGTKLQAVISSQLIESIFNTKAPLHDGAVMILGNKIIAAGCFLPLSQQLTIPKEFGTRHRAAVGITEAYPNMVAIVVSEETGIISIAQNGLIKSYADHKMLSDKLNEIYGITQVTRSNNKKFWWKK